MNMLQKRTLWLTGLGLALLVPGGCYDFDQALTECELSGRCPVKQAECKPEAVDPPDDSFQDSDCDGVDGTVSAAVFVDPVAGQDTQPGTPEAPVRTLFQALRVAQSLGRHALYLAQGDYDEPEFELDTPVSLHGGYSGVEGGWKRSRDFLAHIRGGPIGLTVRELGEDAGVVIERVRITSSSPDDRLPGAPSIGMRVLNSGGVRLRHVEIHAGTGAAGAAGTPGQNNTQTAQGGNPGQNTAMGNGFSNVPVAKGGTPGLSSCGDNGFPGAAGGDGGTHSVVATSGTTSLAGAKGGLAGPPRSSCTQENPCHCQGAPGEPGDNGPVGVAGPDGDAGNGIGRLDASAGTWLPASGWAGLTGGRGGGGGGGGGGGYCTISGVWSEGSGGGGGGAGGCPGTGATGGGGGGASIALLLVQGRVELDFSLLKTAGGGAGGAGGQGGDGSPGGQGGNGGEVYTRQNQDASSTGGRGGQGGNGGQGGRGGHGGNGAGGPSIGIWCNSTSSALEKSPVSYVLGEPGSPGNGPGLKDVTVHKYARHQCPPAR
jgi:hypothetical protein